MNGLVSYHPRTVSQLMGSFGRETIEAIQRGPLEFIWLMASFAAEESGLETLASSMVYVRDYETEVFFFQLEAVGDKIFNRRLIYDGEEFIIRSELNEDTGEWEKFPVEGEGLSILRRAEIMGTLIEICEAQITFLTPTGRPGSS
jgi:hypothetical protein